jgi:hypothetical protein
MTEQMSPSDYEPIEEKLTPDQQKAWELFHAHPDVVSAQTRYTAREAELHPLRELFDTIRLHYNGELTKARITFQEETHTPMLELTETLRGLDLGAPANLDELDGSK